MLTPQQQKYIAWDLTRKRNSSDDDKFTSVLAEAQVDLNPHQIDAALFAFRSPLSMGAILADEVGLGKTIEAALVISQQWAQRNRRILIIAPATLRKQWSMELAEKFFLPSVILENKNFNTIVADGYNMNDVYENRSDLQSLQLAVKLYEQKQNVARAEMLPNIALVGAYTFSNPNVFNGFDKSFNGMFSVGATVSIPLWHWGGRYNKLRAAKSETLIKQLELDDAKEKVEMQVSQAVFKTKESLKTLQMTENNLAKADENLRQAQLGYREGMNSIDNVMEAQTAWLKANSEHIDAGIDVQMCNVYLSKVLGTLTY